MSLQGEADISGRRVIERKVLQELKEFRDKLLPEPQADWDLIWVISGAELFFEQGAGVRNETYDRMQTGFNLVKAVSAKRLGKELNEVTIADIKDFGPRLYFNGREEQNNDMRDLILKKSFEQYDIPNENILIALIGSNILHTGHQFEKFPQALIEGSRKIVIVSSVRHLPRVRRYVGLKTNPFKDVPKGKLVFYPALPMRFPLKDTLREIKVIPRYEQTGFLKDEE